MPNGATHQVAAFVSIAAASAYVDKQSNQVTARPLVDGAAAMVLTNMPDWIEPALHPNHRQFFHSVPVAIALAYGLYRAYKWEPTEDWEKIARWFALIGGGAYLVHLALDARTPKSLPMFGKL
jgi:inner membrane protein